jgi:hypothetical protein
MIARILTALTIVLAAPTAQADTKTDTLAQCYFDGGAKIAGMDPAEANLIVADWRHPLHPALIDFKASMQNLAESAVRVADNGVPIDIINSTTRAHSGDFGLVAVNCNDFILGN